VAGLAPVGCREAGRPRASPGPSPRAAGWLAWPHAPAGGRPCPARRRVAGRRGPPLCLRRGREGRKGEVRERERMKGLGRRMKMKIEIEIRCGVSGGYLRTTGGGGEI